MDFMAAVRGPIEVPEVSQVLSVFDKYASKNACQVLRDRYLPEIERMKAQALAHVVTDEASQNVAITMAGQAKKLATAIEKKRKEVIEAPGEFVKTVNSFVKVFRDSLDDIERKLKAGIQAQMIKVQMEQREAQERARIEAEKTQRELDARAAALNAQREADAWMNEQKGFPAAPVEPEVVAPTVMAPVVPVQKVFRSETGSSMYLRKEWDWELVDIRQVPVSFLLVDEVAINQVVKSGSREISGIRIYEVERMVMRA